jgi:AraC-like DNA-binding protein
MAKISEGFKGQRFFILPFYVVEQMGINEMTKDLYVHSLGHYPNAYYHFYEREQGCNENILIYCIRGVGWYILRGNKYIVEENQFFIIPAHEAHSYGADEQNPWSIYWIHFKGNKSSHFANDFTEPTSLNVEKDSRIDERINLFNEIYNTLKSGYTEDNLIYSSLCLGHFLGTLKYLRIYREAKDENEFGNNIINLATHYMNENLDKKLTLKTIASKFGYSPSFFYRLFYKSSGFSPMKYFMLLKIHKACYLLSHTNYKVSQIAFSLGFTDQYYFSRIFLQSTKMTPTGYRKLNFEK